MCHYAYRHFNELEAVYELRDCTLICPQCHKRMVIDAALTSIDYCKCSNKTHCSERGKWQFLWSFCTSIDNKEVVLKIQ
jgi:hypothetical protein